MAEPLPWRPISELPEEDMTILARTMDGRVMVWRTAFLRTAMQPNIPEHLRFAAVEWLEIR